MLRKEKWLNMKPKFYFYSLFVSSLFVFLNSSCTSQLNVKTKSIRPLVSPQKSEHPDAVEIAPPQMDRISTANFLNSRFGGQSSAITQKLILPFSSDFGGRCDPKTNPNLGCDESEASALAQSKLNLTRFALTLRACEGILGSSDGDNAVRNAGKLALGINTDLPTMGKNEINAAWNLFFPGKTISKTVENSFLTLVSQSKEQTKSMSANDQILDQWRFTFLTLCKSPEWINLQ